MNNNCSLVRLRERYTYAFSHVIIMRPRTGVIKCTVKTADRLYPHGLLSVPNVVLG